MTPGPEAQEVLFYNLIAKVEPLTDDDMQTLRLCLNKMNFNMVRGHVLGVAQLRTNVELIESLRNFDRASGKLVATTNRLTWWILGLTVLATLLAGASLWLSYLSLSK